MKKTSFAKLGRNFKLPNGHIKDLCTVSHHNTNDESFEHLNSPKKTMSTLNSMCLTCLSNLEEGARLTEALKNFLCDVLHFKTEILQESPKIICRKCYKTLIELKCFYTQLRDVEVYFESKSKINTDADDDIEDEADEEPYIGDLECTVSIADDSKLDPILIDEDEECCVVEDDNALKQNKSSDSATGRRFVCLTCSKLFSSVGDLRSHETIHSLTPLQKPSPVFLAATNSQSPPQFTCPECRQEFCNKFTLDTHMKKHKKIRPFVCKSCKHRFAKRDQLICHESKYECMVCQNKCCSRTALETHMIVKHNGNMNGSHGILDTDMDQQHENNIAGKQEP